LRNQLTEALAQEKLHRNEARRHEEDSIRARKESERAIAKASTIPSKKLSNGEAELQEKYEKSMVRWFIFSKTSMDILTIFTRKFCDAQLARRILEVMF